VNFSPAPTKSTVGSSPSLGADVGESFVVPSLPAAVFGTVTLAAGSFAAEAVAVAVFPTALAVAAFATVTPTVPLADVSENIGSAGAFGI
jgi:hypothetical protein